MQEEEKDKLEDQEEDDNEIEELKTFSIEESVKIRKAERDQRNKEFHEKLDKLKEKTARLKKEYDEKYKK
ncbi:TPA: hypothetical protein QCU60_004335 [Bacillus cereus]|nr:hypothetical protein [Bacillus cereus]HDR6312349.1 hypothetical protein [Bacillus cereus]